MRGQMRTCFCERWRRCRTRTGLRRRPTGGRNFPPAVRRSDRGARSEAATADMTNSDWWARAKLPPRRSRSRSARANGLACCARASTRSIWSSAWCRRLREELILSVNGHWRRMRVFRQHALEMLTISVAATVKSLEAKGWAHRQRRLAGVPRCSKMSFGDEDLA